ncbi:MAG TPA: hypothetical protein IAC20_06030 [Candidatus Faecisoma merdavium]|nr:hypothetical protein [Candidatus Faecisoma merdavium]
MPSRMEKYYESKSRAIKNKDLYRTIYDEVEYTNVEGISVIEKNEKIDIEKIKELINGTNNVNKPKEYKKEDIKPLVEEIEEQKNYDIRDVLNKAKSERTDRDSKYSKTNYNILSESNLNTNVTSDQLKDMIETISNNSKNSYTSDLLDDLKSICDPNLKSKIKEQEENNDLQNTKLIQDNIDKSFFTSSMDFSSEDFEDLKEIKENIKKNNLLTKVLLFILLVIIVTGTLLLIYHFKG